VTQTLQDPALDLLFRDARSHNGWVEETLPTSLFHQIYDVVKFGPTSVNSSPARFVWVTSPEAKKTLSSFASGTNAPKILAAPVTVIVGYNLDFAAHLDKLFPHAPGVKDWFAAPELEQVTAFRNGTLQGAYLIIAARALGLNAGPMSGFDNAGVDEAFFKGTRIKSNFIVSLGHGTDENLFPRSPRLSFEEANQIV
jgi:3-hydroxypropanoate dehydrogenase